jgi:hypothetical protein
MRERSTTERMDCVRCGSWRAASEVMSKDLKRVMNRTKALYQLFEEVQHLHDHLICDGCGIPLATLCYGMNT